MGTICKLEPAMPIRAPNQEGPDPLTLTNTPLALGIICIQLYFSPLGKSTTLLKTLRTDLRETQLQLLKRKKSID